MSNHQPTELELLYKEMKRIQDRIKILKRDELPCLALLENLDGIDTVVIEFDGGTSCNIPRLGLGKGYGSYKIDDLPIARVEFGMGHSCNSAELRTITAALIDLHGLCEFTGGAKKTRVIVRGDSQIALKWVNPLHKKEPKPTSTKEFIEAIHQARHVASMFHSIKSEWRSREYSVQLFGH